MHLTIWFLLCLILNTVHIQYAAPIDDDDIEFGSPSQLEWFIDQLANPSPENQLRISAIRSRLRDFLRDRQLAYELEQQQNLDEYDYPDEEKRSIASLASQGYMLIRPEPKRGLASLAKNGQLPTGNPNGLEMAPTTEQWSGNDKRYIGSLARSGAFAGKRNIGTLARDFQLPQAGKRNLATLARLGLLSPNRDPKRNVASLARINSFRGAAEKRNIGALKSSPIHGVSQKKNSNMMTNAEMMMMQPDAYSDYGEMIPNVLLYPSYGDYLDSLHEEKRFLGRVFPPTRTTSATNRSRL